MRCFCLMSNVCLSVTYIGPKSRSERPRKTKIGTEVAHISHVIRTPLSRSKRRRSRSPGRFAQPIQLLLFFSGRLQNPLPPGAIFELKIHQNASPRTPLGSLVFFYSIHWYAELITSTLETTQIFFTIVLSLALKKNAQRKICVV